MNEWTQIGVLAGGVALFAFVLIQLIGRQRERARKRLTKLLSESEIDIDLGRVREPVLGELTKPFAEQFPLSPEGQKELFQLLRQAGYYSPTALMEYSAIRAVMIVLPLLLTGLLALLVDRNQMSTVLIGGAAATMLGYSVPRIYVDAKARARRRDIERGLPVAVDLLSLSLLGGQTVYHGLERVTRELGRSFPALSEELEIVRFQAQVSSLSIALEEWGQRTRIPEVHNLVVILTQAEQQGVDITTALFEYSTNFRQNLRQRAEAMANRASVWLVFPTILCLWVPAALVLAGPIFFELREKRKEAQAITQDIQDQVRESQRNFQQNRSGTAPGPASAQPIP